MRMMMTVKLNTAKANELVRAGKLDQTIGRILDQIKPEAGYFVAEDGKRTGYLIVHMEANSDICGLAEPWFLAFDAEIALQPVMVAADLEQAGPAMEAVAKAFG